MAKGVHRIGNKGKFFILKLNPSYSPLPRDFIFDFKTHYPTLLYLSPQQLIISANKKEAEYTPLLLRSMLSVSPFCLSITHLCEVYLLALEVSNSENGEPTSFSQLKV